MASDTSTIFFCVVIINKKATSPTMFTFLFGGTKSEDEKEKELRRIKERMGRRRKGPPRAPPKKKRASPKAYLKKASPEPSKECPPGKVMGSKGRCIKKIIKQNSAYCRDFPDQCDFTASPKKASPKKASPKKASPKKRDPNRDLNNLELKVLSEAHKLVRYGKKKAIDVGMIRTALLLTVPMAFKFIDKKSAGGVLDPAYFPENLEKYTDILGEVYEMTEKANQRLRAFMEHCDGDERCLKFMKRVPRPTAPKYRQSPPPSQGDSSSYSAECLELGFTDDMTEKERKKHYRKMSLKHHPDRGGSTETMKTLNNCKDDFVGGACVEQFKGRYVKPTRISPPYPANDPDCRSTRKRGRDGFMWKSKGNSAGIHRWVPDDETKPKKSKKKAAPKRGKGGGGKGAWIKKALTPSDFPGQFYVQEGETFTRTTWFTAQLLTLRYNSSTKRVEEAGARFPLYFDLSTHDGGYYQRSPGSEHAFRVYRVKGSTAQRATPPSSPRPKKVKKKKGPCKAGTRMGSRGRCVKEGGAAFCRDFEEECEQKASKSKASKPKAKASKAKASNCPAGKRMGSKGRCVTVGGKAYCRDFPQDCIKGGMNFDLGSGDDEVGEVGEQSDEELTDQTAIDVPRPRPSPTRIFTELVDPDGDEVMVQLATQEALTEVQYNSLRDYMVSRHWNWTIRQIPDPDMYTESDLPWDATFVAWLDGGDHQTENEYGEALGPIVFRAYSQMDMGIVWPDIIQQNSLLYPFFLSFNGGRVTVMTGSQEDGGADFIQRHQDAIDNRILRVYRDMINQSMTLPELLEHREDQRLLAELNAANPQGDDNNEDLEFSDDDDLINPDFQGGDDDCVKEDDWVLPKRKGPPFRASRCKGQEKEGNDGKVWTSTENNGRWQWQRRPEQIDFCPPCPGAAAVVGCPEGKVKSTTSNRCIRIGGKTHCKQDPSHPACKDKGPKVPGTTCTGKDPKREYVYSPKGRCIQKWGAAYNRYLKNGDL
jgi:hypothetical protein